MGDDTDEAEDSSNEDESRPAPTAKRSKEKPSIQWRKSTKFTKVISTDMPMNLVDSFHVLVSLSPSAIWGLLFDEKMLMHIVQQSNLYANREKNDVEFEVTGDKMYRFLGILLLSGYHCLPEEMDC
jgi:hypothetical protein